MPNGIQPNSISLVQPALESVPESIRSHFRKLKPLQSIAGYKVREQVNSTVSVIEGLTQISDQAEYTEAKGYVKAYLNHYVKLLAQFNDKLDEAKNLIQSTRTLLANQGDLASIVKNLHQLIELQGEFKEFQYHGKIIANIYNKITALNATDCINAGDLQLLGQLNTSKIFDPENKEANKYLEVANDVVALAKECQQANVSSIKLENTNKSDLDKYATTLAHSNKQPLNFNFLNELLGDTEVSKKISSNKVTNSVFQKLQTSDIYKLAVSLTIQSAKRFKAITKEELLSPDDYTNPEVCKNIVEISRNAELLTAHVRNSVLENGNVPGCISAIQKWIEVAYLCYKFGNYADSTTILAVLNGAVLSSFLYDGEKFSKYYFALPTEVRQHFEKLSTQLDIKKTILLDETTNMYIPYLGKYTGILTLTLEKVKDKESNPSEIINIFQGLSRVQDISETLQQMQNSISDYVAEKGYANSAEEQYAASFDIMFASERLKQMNLGEDIDAVQRRAVKSLLQDKNQLEPSQRLLSNVVDFNKLTELTQLQSKFFAKQDNTKTSNDAQPAELARQQAAAPLVIFAYGTWEKVGKTRFVEAFAKACDVHESKKIILDDINLAGTNVNEKVITALNQIKEHFLTNIRLGLPVPKKICGVGFSRGAIALNRITHGINNILIPQILANFKNLNPSDQNTYLELIKALEEVKFAIFGSDAVAGLGNKSDEEASIIPENVEESVTTYQTGEEREIMKGWGYTRQRIAAPTQTSSTILPLSGRHVDGGRIHESSKGVKSEAAKINWLLAIEFCQRHGVGFKDNKLPPIPKKAPVEGNSKKSATNFVDMTDELNEIINEPAKRAELYAELKSNKTYGERAKSRFGHEDPERFVLDSDVFMNKDDRESFKKAYGKLFNIIFENNCDDVNFADAKCELELMQKEYPKTFLKLKQTRAIPRAELDPSIAAVNFEYNSEQFALPVNGKRQRENFAFSKALPVAHSPLTLMAYLVREGMYKYIRNRSELMRNADYQQADVILQKLDNILISGGRQKDKVGKIFILLNTVKNEIDQERKNNNFSTKTKDMLSREDLSETVQLIFEKYEKFLPDVSENNTELEEDNFAALEETAEQVSTSVFKRSAILQLIASLDPEVKLTESQGEAILNIIKKLSKNKKHFDSIGVIADAVPRAVAEEIESYFSNDKLKEKGLEQLNSHQRKVMHLAVVRNQLELDKKWKTLWEAFTIALSKVDEPQQAEIKQLFEQVKLHLAPDNIYNVVYSQELYQDILDAKTQARLDHCVKTNIIPILNAENNLKQLKSIIAKMGAINIKYRNAFEEYFNHINNWVAHNLAVVMPVIEDKRASLAYEATDQALQAAHQENLQQIYNKEIYALFAHPELTNNYLDNAEVAQQLNELTGQDVSPESEVDSLKAIFVGLGIELNEQQINKIQVQNNIIRKLPKNFPNDEFLNLVSSYPELARSADKISVSTIETLKGEKLDIQSLITNFNTVSQQELDLLKLSCINSYFTKTISELNEKLNSGYLKNPQKAGALENELKILRQQYDQTYFSQQFFGLPAERLYEYAEPLNYLDNLQDIPNQLFAMNTAIQAEFPYRKKLLQINALVKLPDAATILLNNVADIQIPDSLSDANRERLATAFNDLMTDTLVSQERVLILFKQYGIVIGDEVCKKLTEYASRKQKTDELAAIFYEKVKTIHAPTFKDGQALYQSVSAEISHEEIEQSVGMHNAILEKLKQSDLQTNQKINTYINAVINTYSDIVEAFANYTDASKKAYALANDVDPQKIGADDLLPLQITYLTDHEFSKDIVDKILSLDEAVYTLDPGILTGISGYYFNSGIVNSSTYLSNFDKPINSFEALENSVTKLMTAINKFETEKANLSTSEQHELIATVQKIQTEEVINYTANITELNELLVTAKRFEKDISPQELVLYKPRLDKLADIAAKFPMLKADIQYCTERLAQFTNVSLEKPLEAEIVTLQVDSVSEANNVQNIQPVKQKYNSNVKARLRNLLQVIQAISDTPLNMFEALAGKVKSKLSKDEFEKVKTEVLTENELQLIAQQQMELKQAIKDPFVRNAALAQPHSRISDDILKEINLLTTQENIKPKKLTKQLLKISNIKLSEEGAQAVIESASIAWLDKNIDAIESKYSIAKLPAKIQELDKFARSSYNATNSKFARLKKISVNDAIQFITELQSLGDLEFLTKILEISRNLSSQVLSEKFPQWNPAEVAKMYDTLNKIVHKANKIKTTIPLHAVLDQVAVPQPIETTTHGNSSRTTFFNDSEDHANEISNSFTLHAEFKSEPQLSQPMFDVAVTKNTAIFDHGDIAKQGIFNRALDQYCNQKAANSIRAELVDGKAVFKKKEKDLGFYVTQDGSIHFNKGKDNKILHAKEGFEVCDKIGLTSAEAVTVKCSSEKDAQAIARSLRKYNSKINIYFQDKSQPNVKPRLLEENTNTSFVKRFSQKLSVR